MFKKNYPNIFIQFLPKPVCVFDIALFVKNRLHVYSNIYLYVYVE